MKKINVLLSTYNGKRYLREQMDSILAQTYDNVSVWIRDDGSADGTKEMLAAFSARPKVHVVYGENVGFIKSFLSLLQLSDEADLYAFCDQDDVWLPDKLERAAKAFESLPEGKPCLYFSAYEICDENLNVVSQSSVPGNISFPNCLVDCAPLGFVSVMNRRARDMILENMPRHCCGHDWWAYMLCESFGEVFYDSVPTVKYRRTGANVSAGGANFLRLQVWRFRKFFKGGYFKNVSAQIAEFGAIYQNALSASQKQLIALFNEKSLKRVVYGRRFRQNGTDEFFLRSCFLLGKL